MLNQCTESIINLNIDPLDDEPDDIVNICHECLEVGEWNGQDPASGHGPFTLWLRKQ